MSLLTYNGISLFPCQVLDYRKDYVYDGPVYLWTKHTIRVRGVYNPATTSWAQNDPQNPVPVPAVGALTEEAVRHFLAQPRQYLVYSVGNVPVLTSPPLANVNGNVTPLGCDANNGPFPTVGAVTRVSGAKTFVVEAEFSTCINECWRYRSAATLGLALSQRWEMSHDIDEDFYTTRTVRGHVIFRTDLMQPVGNLPQAFPDDFRNFLFHPVPPNFKRENIRVVAHPDGHRLDYSFTDVEQAVNMTTAVTQVGVTRIEAFLTKSISKPNDDDSDFVMRQARWQRRLAWGSLLPTIAGALASKGRSLSVSGNLDINAIVNTEFAFEGATRGTIPRQTTSLVVRVYGNRDATRRDLHDVAMQVLLSKVSDDAVRVGGTTLSCTEDLMGTFVSLQCTVLSAPAPLAFAAANGVAFPYVRPGDDAIDQVTTFANLPNPLPPGDLTSRGTYREEAVAQALATPCAIYCQPAGTPVSQRTAPANSCLSLLTAEPQYPQPGGPPEPPPVQIPPSLNPQPLPPPGVPRRPPVG